MKHLVITSLLALVALVSGAQEPTGKVREVKLSNGLTVWLDEVHTTPNIFGVVGVKAGARDCADTGIAHYFEHIMFKGTDEIGTVDYAAEKVVLDSIADAYDRLGKLSGTKEREALLQEINGMSLRAAQYAIPNEFSRLITMAGGSGLNAATGQDYTYYHNTFGREFLPQWLELNSHRLIHPVFRLFQTELETVYEEKNLYSDMKTHQVGELIQSAFYGDHPYGKPIIGSTENLKNPSPHAMARFYEDHYKAGNMVLILSGDFNSEEVIPMLESTFGRIPGGTVERQKMPAMPQYNGENRVLELPMGEGFTATSLAFPHPGSKHPDADLLDMTTMMLAIMLGHTAAKDENAPAVQMMPINYEEGGMINMLIFNRDPYGSDKKAEKRVLEEIENLKKGEFNDSLFVALKYEMLRGIKTAFEDNESRAMSMLEEFCIDTPVDSLFNDERRVQAVTREDLAATASKYFNKNYLHFTLVNGNSKKDRLKQPGYEPVQAPHASEQSAYAKSLAEHYGNKATQINLPDLKRNVIVKPIGMGMKLYATKNPQNDVFNLTLVFEKGADHDKRISYLPQYLEELGTDSLTQEQFSDALKAIGTSMEFGLSGEKFMIRMEGFDENFDESLHLLGHFLGHVKADEKKFDELVTSVLFTDYGQGFESEEVSRAVMAYVMYGGTSPLLNRYTAKRVKRIGGEGLLHAFKTLRMTDISVIYSGGMSAYRAAKAIGAALPAQTMYVPLEDPFLESRVPQEPTVYFYHVPDTRQVSIRTYQSLEPLTTPEDRVLAELWEGYYGSDMSSVLFQEMREFRSLGYSVAGMINKPSLEKHADAPVDYMSFIGTQGDKMEEALATLDKLMVDMPVREHNFEASRQKILNSINASYPTYRNMGTKLAMNEADGNTVDMNQVRARVLPTLTMEDVVRFHNEKVKPRTRVIVIVGDRKYINKKALKPYGRFVELKREDVFKVNEDVSED